MYFDRVVASDGRVEAYFRGELVRLRVRGSDGWVDMPIDTSGREKEKTWKQVSLPVARKTDAGMRVEPHYEEFEEAP